MTWTVMLKLVRPDHLWLPQLVPNPGGPGLELEPRAILISAYASRNDAGQTTYGVTGHNDITTHWFLLEAFINLCLHPFLYLIV